MDVIRGILGILLIIAIAVLFSNNRRKISKKLVINGLLIQLFFASLIIYGERLKDVFMPFGFPKMVLDWMGNGVVKLLNFVASGSQFIFGSLAIPQGTDGSMGFFFAFQVLPTIIFFASLTAILYYLGVLQKVVKFMAAIMARLLGTSGAESLSNTANIFVGQTEAPILIRPFISTMTKSELLTIMVGGMATVAGGVMATYVQILGKAWSEIKGIGIDEAMVQFAVHLITASVMAAPASIVISKILFPETLTPKTLGKVSVKVEKNASNVIEAAANGVSDGLKLALNVGAMLLVFIALINLVNFLFTEAGSILGVNEWLKETYGHEFSMQLVLGLILKYIAIGIGVPAQDALHFGSLFGTKIVLNEFVAYVDLVGLIKKGMLTEKGIIMSTYALCGFANFSSIAIQIGGIAPMAPERKKDLAALGLKAVLGGALVTLLTATLAGMLLT